MSKPYQTEGQFEKESNTMSCMCILLPNHPGYCKTYTDLIVLKKINFQKF